jgi:hypothetical protein
VEKEVLRPHQLELSMIWQQMGQNRSKLYCLWPDGMEVGQAGARRPEQYLQEIRMMEEGQEAVQRFRTEKPV